MNKNVKLQNVSLSYGKDIILESISMDIASGDFVIITGRSGSGKSTLFKSFYGELIPDSGGLEVCTQKINKKTSFRALKKLRRDIGVIFQDYKLIHEWDITKNIMLPLLINGYSKNVAQNQAKKLLKHVHLLHYANKYPKELSGGEQQRVAVARAIAHNPKLLLADEPTGNLDQYSSDIIWDLLKGVNKQLGTTVVVVTHKMPSMMPPSFKHFKIAQKNIGQREL